MQRSTTWVWIPYVTLALVWGTSYLWIKIGLESLPPFTLIAARLTLGALFVAAVVAVAREPLPRKPRQFASLLVMSVINIVIPFTLITVGEQSIDSALASILNATVPLFVIVIAPLVLPDERITLARVAGLALGFAGVVLLVAPGLANGIGSSLPAELMLVGSSISYAFGNVFARRNVRGMAPMIPALFQVSFAAVITIPLALLVDHPWTGLSPAPIAFLAVAWLGFLGSGLAYLCFFTVLRHWGSTRTSTSAYLLPVVGITAGAVVLGEAITLNRVGGMALIVVGIAIVSSPGLIRRLLGRPTEGEAENRSEGEPEIAVEAEA